MIPLERTEMIRLSPTHQEVLWGFLERKFGMKGETLRMKEKIPIEAIKTKRNEEILKFVTKSFVKHLARREA